MEGEYVGSGEISINEIINHKEDFEYIFAMQENLDAILDLKVGEKLSLKFNRDYEDSDGFIKRIKD